MESCISRDEKKEIINKNPYYTGIMPSPSSIPHFNAKAESYIKTMGLSKETIRNLSDLEDNPKVGPDGLNIILEFIIKSTKANKNRDYEKRIKVCDNEMYWKIPQLLLDIFKTFDITPKLLIDRTIREMMNNYMNADTYWTYICDYANMCYQLGIEVEKKIPKDVIHRHDILSTKIAELRDESIKEKFSLRVLENKKLLENIPDGDYTIISPETSNDLVEEGFRMNHCVGSYAYSFASGSSKIFFVRKKTNVEIPLATLELDNFNRLIQISSFANSKPEKSYYSLSQTQSTNSYVSFVNHIFYFATPLIFRQSSFPPEKSLSPTNYQTLPEKTNAHRLPLLAFSCEYSSNRA